MDADTVIFLAAFGPPLFALGLLFGFMRPAP